MGRLPCGSFDSRGKPFPRSGTSPPAADFTSYDAQASHLRELRPVNDRDPSKPATGRRVGCQCFRMRRMRHRLLHGRPRSAHRSSRIRREQARAISHAGHCAVPRGAARAIADTPLRRTRSALGARLFMQDAHAKTKPSPPSYSVERNLLAKRSDVSLNTTNRSSTHAL
jgi:hypothetical protein